MKNWSVLVGNSKKAGRYRKLVCCPLHQAQSSLDASLLGHSVLQWTISLKGSDLIFLNFLPEFFARLKISNGNKIGI